MGYLLANFFRRKYKTSQFVKLHFSYSKFLGSSIIEEFDGQWSVSSVLLAFNFFVTLISFLALYMAFTKKDGSSEDSFLLEYLLIFEYLLLFTSRIVNLFSQVVNLEEIRNMIRSFELLDEISSLINYKQVVFDGPPMFCFFLNNFIVIVCLILALSRIKSGLINFTKLFHLVYLHFVMNMDVFSIVVLIYSIQVNLSYFNCCLGTLKSKSSKDGKLHDVSVDYCCKAYNELCSQADRLNTVYGLQLLVVFINIFTVLVDELYHLINLKSTDQLGDNIFEVSILIASLTFIFSITFSITSACDKTISKADEFNTLLYQVMIIDKTSIVSSNKKMRLHALMKREIVFTAYGFFIIDYAQVHSIAAAATTYLVILIQFA